MTVSRTRADSRLGWLVDFSLLVVLCCAAFAALASATVLAGHQTGVFREEPGFGGRLILKAAVFASTAVLGGVLLVRRKRSEPDPAERLKSRDTSYVGWHYAILLAVAVLLLGPNLHRYPWPAPDELHHLTVARNLAVHGAYASGMPPDALVHFDVYDSVGAPVIAPAAATIRPLGPNLATGRFTVVLYGLALPLLAYGFLRPVFGSTAAFAGSLLTFGAFGTVYLSRSFYGEVPALSLLLGALIVWRSALSRRSSQVNLLIVAGLLAGLAVLTKTFLLVGAIGFGGALLYDALTARQVSLRSILIPAAAGTVVLVGWEMFVQFSGLRSPEQVSLVVYYRHLLLFGLPQIAPDFGPLRILVVVVSAAAIGFGARHVVREAPDPAMLGLLLMAVLYVFWWIFFTPMHIARYLWYTAFVAAMMAGPLMVQAWHRFRRPGERSRILTEAPGALIAVVLLAFVPNFVDKTVKVFFVDQAKDERALVRYVRSLPPSVSIATVYWPTERLINYVAHRGVELIDPATTTIRQDHDVVIDSLRRAEAVAKPDALQIGHYIVYESAQTRLARGAPRSGHE